MNSNDWEILHIEVKRLRCLHRVFIDNTNLSETLRKYSSSIKLLMSAKKMQDQPNFREYWVYKIFLLICNLMEKDIPFVFIPL